ncbi:MAG TPA: hypothetical protein PLC18_14270 [Sediminibacterium sp.]|jgi:hypothetical protein|uniref:hypothetical protein n=1 Tax=Sediminibacterium sp. TaxID=1917865 RepID=UPI0009CCE3A3|nr:hypothetical protein [Sediminibacterium sp.]OQA65552.1 MAG: hypothetical protein BWY38_02462 [Ignavibacteria bacterium ADurb.Bin266]HQS36577.1 hypothetical protein [Sediminibacterium sp.]
MKSKLASLGFALSKDVQKILVADNRTINDGGATCGLSYRSCSYYESGTGNVSSYYETNSNGSCICKSANSSIVRD